MLGTVPCVILSLHKDTPKYDILPTTRRSYYYNCDLFLLAPGLKISDYCELKQNFYICRIIYLQFFLTQRLVND